MNNAELDKCVAVLTRCGPFSAAAGKLYAEAMDALERDELLQLHAALALLEEKQGMKPPQVKPDEAREALRLIGERFGKLLDAVADRQTAARKAKEPKPTAKPEPTEPPKP